MRGYVKGCSNRLQWLTALYKQFTALLLCLGGTLQHILQRGSAYNGSVCVCYPCSPLQKVSWKNSDMNWIQLLFPWTTELWAFLMFVNWSEVLHFSVIREIAKNIVKSSTECVIMYQFTAFLDIVNVITFQLINCIDKISRWKCINNNTK